jgi:hypothetical protein
MSESYSLLKILRNDPDFAEALKQKTEAVRKDKKNLLEAATSYTEKYQGEILEGTKLRQKLLTEGEAKGLTEKEIFKGNARFIPTIYTPILNFLYFMFRDEARDEQKRLRELTEQYIKDFGYENVIKVLEEDVDDSKEVTLEEILSNDVKRPEEMEKFVYGNMTHETFKRIKKLKALAQSSNEKEAFLAFRKCHELCKKYGLEFDRIPCNVKTHQQ